VADKKGERASRYMRNIDATRFDEASDSSCISSSPDPLPCCVGNRVPNASGEARTFIDVRSQGKGDLYPSEELVIEVEVDESFAGTRSTG
jgi:hypothetical protein